MTEIITNATTKLEKEANTSGGHNVPAIPIYNHLKGVCEKDEEFAQLVLQENKTLLKCFTYVYEQVKKQVKELTGTQSIWVSDEATYKMAEDYYRLDDAEIERRKEEERKEREAKEKEEAKKRKAEAEKREAEKKAAEKEKKAKKKPKIEPEANQQLTLFE